MNRISAAFRGKKAFIPFITGGDPDIDTTRELLLALCDAGADAIEIGIPFSDPIAEGPVIEAASARALRAGCTLNKLLALAESVRADVNPDVPILFMTYYNPVFHFGAEAFASRCARAGVDGLIVPDLPFEERDELLPPCQTHGVELISLIAPTSRERIERIARASGGFLYCVSSLGVTGERAVLGESARHMTAAVRRVCDIPCAVGFGISTPEQAAAICAFADGVIVGSAIVRIIAEHGRGSAEHVARYAREMKQAVTQSGRDGFA
ncbi:MAG: tryptophan synthase subunit alpha [Oscillospiraceae bacterium]|jgi:tryptophan synthase alpha chain|nr:tryptophan synthase subunit alpha [Oscillospiraceae bacterium]